MSELARVVAAAFRLHGQGTMAPNEFKQLLSFRLNWYVPGDAARLLARGKQAGLLVEEAGLLRPGFPIEQVEVPLDFRGTAWALEEPLSGAAPAPPSQAAPPTPAADPALAERVRALQALASGALSDEAAALLARAERGEDVRAEARRALERMGAPARP